MSYTQNYLGQERIYLIYLRVIGMSTRRKKW